MTSDRRIMFLPNRPSSGDDPDYRIREVRRAARKGRLNGWTCSKTVKQGDVYLFWFGEHLKHIAAIGIAAGNKEEKENRGQFDWTSAKRLWFCDYEPVVQLASPVAIDDLNSIALLRKWWQGKPYQGRPKRLTSDVSQAVSRLILRSNPQAADLLQRFTFGLQANGEAIGYDDDDAPPGTVRTVVERKIRCTAKGLRLKRRHRSECQFGCQKVSCPGIPGVCEVHHLRPLGSSHNGLDNWDNMLVLCPTCHAAIDRLGIRVNPTSLRLECFDPKDPRHGRTIRSAQGHKLSQAELEYHWQRCGAVWKNFRKRLSKRHLVVS